MKLPAIVYGEEDDYELSSAASPKIKGEESPASPSTLAKRKRQKPRAERVLLKPRRVIIKEFLESIKEDAELLRIFVREAKKQHLYEEDKTNFSHKYYGRYIHKANKDLLQRKRELMRTFEPFAEQDRTDRDEMLKYYLSNLQVEEDESPESQFAKIAKDDFLKIINKQYKSQNQQRRELNASVDLGKLPQIRDEGGVQGIQKHNPIIQLKKGLGGISGPPGGLPPMVAIAQNKLHQLGQSLKPLPKPNVIVKKTEEEKKGPKIIVTNKSGSRTIGAKTIELPSKKFTGEKEIEPPKRKVIKRQAKRSDFIWNSDNSGSEGTSSRSQSRSKSTRSFSTTRSGMSKQQITIELNRHNEELRDHFRNIVNDHIKPLGALRLTARNLYEYLIKRYTPHIAKRFIKFIEIEDQRLSFWGYCSLMEEFVQFKHIKLLKLCFWIYDANRDRLICENDLFDLLQNCSNHNILSDTSNPSKLLNTLKYSPSDTFSDIFQHDICTMVKFLNKKIELFRLAQARGNMIPKKQKTSILVDEEKEKQKKLKEQREANSIALREFSRIEFEDSIPHILDDIIKYMCLVTIRTKDRSNIPSNYSSDNERDERSNFSPDKILISNITEEFGNKTAGIIINTFKLLARNPTRREDKIYITMSSIIKNFSKVFGYNNTYIIERFYYILFAANKGRGNKKRIYLETFINLARTLMKGTSSQKGSFAFDIYDNSEDGIIDISDMVRFSEALPVDSLLHNEITKLTDDYLGTHIYKIPGTIKEDYGLTKFLSVIPKSLLIGDFKSKIFKEAIEQNIFGTEVVKQTVEKNRVLTRPLKRENKYATRLPGRKKEGADIALGAIQEAPSSRGTSRGGRL